MGDYSRDPADRLADAVAKRYLGIRFEQGVHVLDADLNALDDIRRHELAATSTWVAGDGVPTGSDGFRILALGGGGVDTLVLIADLTGSDFSALHVDLAASTAADALGFEEANASAAREGGVPARLTGDRAEPFALADGQTLTVVVGEEAPETVTFAAADFADIGAATAQEVADALNAGLARATAAPGTGNDFLIRGARPPFHTGYILAGGQLTLNERDVAYTGQPLYENAALADEWEVAPVPALAPPAADTRQTVYLDVWHREVRAAEDDLLVDPRIGVPTTNRLRREWAVRVIDAVDFAAHLAARPVGHTYTPLAHLDRTTDAAIPEEIVTDLRATEVSLRRTVAFRARDGALLVGPDDLESLLRQTRDNVRDFIAFLTATFVDPNDGYVAGEVAGLEALAAVARVAEQGLALLMAETMSTAAAFALFDELLDAENRLVTTWRDALFLVTKATGTVYRDGFEPMIDTIEDYLTGPAPGTFTPLEEALDGRDMQEAVRTQERINNEFAEEIGRPMGSLTVVYLGSDAATIQQNVPFDLDYRVEGSVTPDDDLDVEVTIDPAWQATVRNEDGTEPLALRLGPGADDARFIVNVRPPNVAGAETSISLRVAARLNSAGLFHQTGQKTLREGDPPPLSEEDMLFTFTTGSEVLGGVVQVPVSTSAFVTFRLTNNTAVPQTVDLDFAPQGGAAAPWSVVQGGFGLVGQVVPAGAFLEFQFMFTAPGAAGDDLLFTLTALDTGTPDVVAETQLSLTSVT